MPIQILNGINRVLINLVEISFYQVLHVESNTKRYELSTS
jgi:hypothetical protein